MSETATPEIETRFLYEALTLLYPDRRFTVAELEAMGSPERNQVHRVAGALQDYEAERLRLRKFATMVSDLDRNEHGRHEGDADAGDPCGVSHGGIRHTGDVLGYSIGGAWKYVMPERGRRHDPDAWKVPNDAE